ncbi:Subtilase family protein [Aliiruegeria lutimaris]|uniref:Subtilase family protein n=1 Tax=Aliiruegeria lutimaris TaxID=571298 RepID=A0A1G9F7Q5_9RHOB|nr:Subtilase family protein [Aliiruegeria lutimaris]
MASKYTLPHINIENRRERADFKSTSERFPASPPPRERQQHGGLLRKQLTSAITDFEQDRPRDDRVAPEPGVYLEVELRPNSNPDSLEKKRSHLKPASAKLDASENRIVGLFVPAEAQLKLESILADYQTGELTEKGKNPPYKPFVEPIEAIRKARLETFWTDDLDALPQNPSDTIWWEVWCVKSAEKELDALAEKLEARCAPAEQRLFFPEHVVVPVLAPRATIELMLFARFSITELRRATDTPVFFIDDLDPDEQFEWTDDLAERIEWPGTDVPAVCLLDSGVNRAHGLIEPALSPTDQYSVRPEWGVDDTGPRPGHGTQMAGIALHGDLVPRLASVDPIRLGHRLESVKILPPPGMEKPDERFYGPITKSAVSIAEIGRPDRRRVFCMAVTNEDISGTQPSTWSAALDQEAAGVTVEDARAPRRLFVVSAGNAPNPIMFHDVQHADTYPIEDPAQAWNVITVGGYTDKIHIAEPGCWQTNSNQSQQGQDRCPLYRAETAPLSESSGAVLLEVGSGREAALRVEMVENRGVDGCKQLQTSHPSEPLHCSLSSSKWQVRILRPVVEPATGFLTTDRADLLQRGTIRSEAVSHDDFRPAVALH